jgi:hypothetical protein
MSSAALVALLVGVFSLGAVLFALLRRTGDLTPGDPPPGWANSTAAQVWDTKAAEARENFGLTQIRDTAGKWAASIAGLLGILSTVAFIAGPKALVTDVGGTEADVAAWLILAAAAVAAVAVTLAILAAQGSPQQTESNGWTYRSLTRQRAELAAAQLNASRYLVITALVLITLATGIAWMSALTGDEPASGQDAIVATSAGAICGTLTDADGSLGLQIGDELKPIGTSAAITLVDDCP